MKYCQNGYETFDDANERVDQIKACLGRWPGIVKRDGRYHLSYNPRSLNPVEAGLMELVFSGVG